MIYNKKFKTLLVFFLFATNVVISQKQTTDFWKNVRFGGSIGLNFGGDFFYASIAPSGIYEFNDRFALGLGLNATYINQKLISKSTILGGSIIGLANLIPELQASAEFEQLNISRKYNANLNFKDENYWTPALFLGIGYRSNNFTVGVRYDVLYNKEKSLYLDPWMPFVRIYF